MWPMSPVISNAWASGKHKRVLGRESMRGRRMDSTGDADPEIRTDEVRRRFVWARRQGRPAWLWPEVPIEAWRLAMEAMGKVTAAILAGEPAPPLDGDPQALGLAGYTSGLGPLLGLWLEQDRLQADEAIAAIMARHLAHNRIRAERLPSFSE